MLACCEALQYMPWFPLIYYMHSCNQPSNSERRFRELTTHHSPVIVVKIYSRTMPFLQNIAILPRFLENLIKNAKCDDWKRERFLKKKKKLIANSPQLLKCLSSLQWILSDRDRKSACWGRSTTTWRSTVSASAPCRLQRIVPYAHS